jgi:zinc transport system ATP-binding protein
MKNILAVEGLSVAFGKTRILEDVSFRVDAGRSLAIIGPNASGKTVLLKALIGAVRYEGLVRWAPGTKIGYLPQKLDIERDLPLTGRDLLRAKAGVARVAPAGMERVLEQVGLPPSAARQPIGTLSGGQFQRLLLAFALMGEPTVLLVDEPTAGVDEPGEQGIAALLEKLKHESGLSLLLVSHELNLVDRLADEVLCLSRRKAWLGTPVSILTPERLREVYGSPLQFHVHDDRR